MSLAPLLLSLISLAQADEPWLTPQGASGLLWGTTERPADAIPRPRSDYLPDSGYIGASPEDQPQDLVLMAPDGEHWYLRYAHGSLADAWLVRQGPINVEEFRLHGQEQWAGVVLGPSAEPGWRAFGYAQSWTITGRTALHWRDRLSSTEILVARDGSSARYAVQRAAPIGSNSHPSTRPVRLSGSLKKLAKPHAAAISGCLDHAPKPVTATVRLRYDGAGRPARIQVETDQPTAGVFDCMAGAVEGTRAPGLSEGDFTAFRMR